MLTISNVILFTDHLYLTIQIREDLLTSTSPSPEVHWHLLCKPVMHFHVWPYISNYDMTSCFSRFHSLSTHLLRRYNVLDTIMYFQYMVGEGGGCSGNIWEMNGWAMNKWPSHSCPSWMQLQRWRREACPSLHPSSFQIWVLSTPAQS